jgi:Neuraminidase (sialidase)
VQTNFTYATGDVNFGVDPEIVGGAYTNNFVGATTTLFYAVDHDLDTLVTIADKTATGSSNTGNGKLQTIGALVDLNGNKLNLSPSADLDIYTDANGTNFLVGISTGQLFSINLSQINPNLPLGTTQNVVVKVGPLPPLLGTNAPITGGVIDIAFQPIP